MPCVLGNCEYDKIKLLHKLSCISWFIKKHALSDAKENSETDFLRLLEKLDKDLDEHLKQLKLIACSCKK